MSEGPSKKEIEAIFLRLRSIPANKVCFDCNSKNPTWASVTYGVFICIDCSAVHRGLGVHLTFVRSTQLDTNWTWLQLRQMQVGGNSNATQFFTQHNCITPDAQQKYNSRAAQLYREKLQKLAQQALVKYANELHINVVSEPTPATTEKEIDFFNDTVTAETNLLPSLESDSNKEKESTASLVQHRKLTPYYNMASSNDLEISYERTKVEFNGEPSINLNPEQKVSDRKPIIGVRRVQAKKTMGAKKGFGGATRVKTDFEEIEREAALAEENRQKAKIEAIEATAISVEQQEKQMASMRLAYQDIEAKQKKEEDKLKQTDPNKAQQVERLGMGFGTKTGISHSAITDMQTIEQDHVELPNAMSSLWRKDESDVTSSWCDSPSSMPVTSSDIDRLYKPKPSLNDIRSINIDWPETSSPKKEKYQTPDRGSSSSKPMPDSSDTAQRKFGGAKSISSDQYFDNGADDWERKTNLTRFQDSNSISSADYFGTKKETNDSYNFNAPDLEDVRESVKQGVTKAAERLGSVVNGFMSSLQDRYGY